MTPHAAVQSGRSFPQSIMLMKTNKTGDQSRSESPHGRGVQITGVEQVCGKEGEMWSGVEDETEYEAVNRRSTLLIPLFDLRLGRSSIYIHAGGTRALYVSVGSQTLHVHKHICHLYYADVIFFHISSLSYMHTSHLISNHSSSHGFFFA